MLELLLTQVTGAGSAGCANICSARLSPRSLAVPLPRFSAPLPCINWSRGLLDPPGEVPGSSPDRGGSQGGCKLHRPSCWCPLLAWHSGLGRAMGRAGGVHHGIPAPVGFFPRMPSSRPRPSLGSIVGASDGSRRRAAVSPVQPLMLRNSWITRPWC